MSTILNCTLQRKLEAKLCGLKLLSIPYTFVLASFGDGSLAPTIMAVTSLRFIESASDYQASHIRFLPSSCKWIERVPLQPRFTATIDFISHVYGCAHNKQVRQLALTSLFVHQTCRRWRARFCWHFGPLPAAASMQSPVDVWFHHRQIRKGKHAHIFIAAYGLRRSEYVRNFP